MSGQTEFLKVSWCQKIELIELAYWLMNRISFFSEIAPLLLFSIQLLEIQHNKIIITCVIQNRLNNQHFKSKDRGILFWIKYFPIISLPNRIFYILILCIMGIKGKNVHLVSIWLFKMKMNIKHQYNSITAYPTVIV